GHGHLRRYDFPDNSMVPAWNPSTSVTGVATAEGRLFRIKSRKNSVEFWRPFCQSLCGRSQRADSRVGCRKGQGRVDRKITAAEPHSDSVPDSSRTHPGERGSDVLLRAPGGGDQPRRPDPERTPAAEHGDALGGRRHRAPAAKP